MPAFFSTHSYLNENLCMIMEFFGSPSIFPQQHAHWLNQKITLPSSDEQQFQDIFEFFIHTSEDDDIKSN